MTNVEKLYKRIQQQKEQDKNKLDEKVSVAIKKAS